MGDVERFPWDPPVPAVIDAELESIVKLVQADMRFMVAYTCVRVRSNRPELEMLVNTPRGQIVPRGECKFTDGTTFELQDIGMPQVGVSTATVQELMATLWRTASELGLEL